MKTLIILTININVLATKMILTDRGTDPTSVNMVLP